MQCSFIRTLRDPKRESIRAFIGDAMECLIYQPSPVLVSATEWKRSRETLASQFESFVGVAQLACEHG